jgi:hypothetical protein
MPTNKLALFAAALFMAVAFGGWTHGSAPTFEGANWHEVLEKVPCQYVTKVGKDLKIAVTLVVDGKTFKNPTITEEDRIKELEKRCFPKH